MIFQKLRIGARYSKKELSILLDNSNIAIIREGIFNYSRSETLFFVDLEKQGKEERFHFEDYFQGDYFHWDSQTTQHINTPKIQEIVRGTRTPHLFVRLRQKVRSRTQPFIYCGRLKYEEHEPGTAKPVHMIFQNIDYNDDTEDLGLLEIYNWRPEKAGKTSTSKISKNQVISQNRVQNYKKPNRTERSGLVTSRVGQGYYRQNVRAKWNNTCPVTGCKVLRVLIASHIVPWSECNSEQRLDVENGILLSPNADSLFDRHLISFSDEGQLLFSEHIQNDLKLLGIPANTQIPVSEGMKPYLQKHRMRFHEIN